MTEPVRNLLVYGDGRIQVTPFRLEGNYYLQNERAPDGTQLVRRFEGGYAVSTELSDPEKGTFTMVYVERPEPSPCREFTEAPTVNGQPILTPALPWPHKTAKMLHRECVQSGGHGPGMRARDICERCGLSGYAIRHEEQAVRRADEDQRSAGGLRDQLMVFVDENRALKVENSELRREVERLTRASKVR